MPAPIPFPEYPLGTLVKVSEIYNDWPAGLVGEVVGYTGRGICVYFRDAPEGCGHEGLSALRSGHPHNITAEMGNWFIHRNHLTVLRTAEGLPKRKVAVETRKPRNERHGGAKITVCQLNTDI